MNRFLSIIFFLYFNVAAAEIYKFPLSSGAIVIIKTHDGISFNQAVTRVENKVSFNLEVRLGLHFPENKQQFCYQPAWAPEILKEVYQIIGDAHTGFEQFSITGAEYRAFIDQMPYMYAYCATPGTYIECAQASLSGLHNALYSDPKSGTNRACGSSVLADADSIFMSSPGVDGVLCAQSYINALPKTRRCGFRLTNKNGESKNIYPCRVFCGRVFFNTEYRTQHHKTHLTHEQLKNYEKGEEITCTNCGRSFTHLHVFIKHLSGGLGCSN